MAEKVSAGSSAMQEAVCRGCGGGGLEKSVQARLCIFGVCCRNGLNCPWWHSDADLEHFNRKRELAVTERDAACGYCARGICRYGDGCLRNVRSAGGGAFGGIASSESDYSSDDGSEQTG